MTAQNNTVQYELLKCEVCLKEIPLSEADSVEATDYVLHFCGLECYSKWKAQSTDEESES